MGCCWTTLAAIKNQPPVTYAVPLESIGYDADHTVIVMTKAPAHTRLFFDGLKAQYPEGTDKSGPYHIGGEEHRIYSHTMVVSGQTILFQGRTQYMYYGSDFTRPNTSLLRIRTKEEHEHSSIDDRLAEGNLIMSIFDIENVDGAPCADFLRRQDPDRRLSMQSGLGVDRVIRYIVGQLIAR